MGRKQKKKYKSIIILPGLSRFFCYPAIFFFFSFLISCQAFPTRPGSAIQSIELQDYQVTLYYPGSWEVSIARNRFFQFIARNEEQAMVEYRGLESTRFSEARQDEYSRGWLDAMPRNYRNFNYLERGKTMESPDTEDTVYHFEGSYTENDTRYRKIGRLRFRGERIHAIYYTAPEEYFEKWRSTFLQIDTQHRYN